MRQPEKQEILRQIAAIVARERGKLSVYSFEDRPGLAGPYSRLQRWANGENPSRYFPAEEVPAVQAALAGHAPIPATDRALCRFGDRGDAAEHRRLKKPFPAAGLSCPRRVNPATDRLFSIRSAARQRGRPAEDMGVYSRFQVGQRSGRLVASASGRAHRRGVPAQTRGGFQGPGNHRCTGDFGHFELNRDYHHHAGKSPGHYPADAALELAVGLSQRAERSVHQIPPPMPRWGWQRATPRPWPSSCVWKEPTKPPTGRRSGIWSKPAASRCRAGRFSG